MQKTIIGLGIGLGLAAVTMGCTSDPAPLGQGRSSAPIVYGNDDRLDPYQVTDTTLANAVRGYDVALMTETDYDATNPNAVTFLGETLSVLVCPGERFTDQLMSAFCSGTPSSEA